MGERKVLNKYFPPDFDPDDVPKRTSRKDEVVKVRVMLPMTVQCDTCGEFIYRGKKFNSRKEDVENEDYLGLRIFRFYVKCPTCCQEIVFKTDPQNSDYKLESGAQRNYEPWKQKEQYQEMLEKMREQEERGDSMRALENRTIESKREMDILDALEEIRELNARNFTSVDDDDVLEKTQKRAILTLEQRQQIEDEEDNELIAQAFNNKQNSKKTKTEHTPENTTSTSTSTSTSTTTTMPPPPSIVQNVKSTVKKATVGSDDDEEETESRANGSRGGFFSNIPMFTQPAKSVSGPSSSSFAPPPAPPPAPAGLAVRIAVKKKPDVNVKKEKKRKKDATKTATTATAPASATVKAEPSVKKEPEL